MTGMPRTSHGAALALALIGAGGLAGMAQAHHSFAVFFEPDKIIKISGKVTAFSFTNPHGTITLDATGPDGKAQVWRVETNAPVVLMRRGWTRTSLKPGDMVTIDGWASRDGKPYMRLRQAVDAAGKPIGQTAFGQSDS